MIFLGVKSYRARCSEDQLDGMEAGPRQTQLVEQSTVPAAVRKILAYRCLEGGSAEASRTDTSPGGHGVETARHAEAARHHALPEEWTDKLREFSEGAARARAGFEEGRSHIAGGLEVRTFLDLQAYDLGDVAEKQRRAPGSAQLMYMFYSRIYEKLVGKQRGVDVPLFAPVDFGERLLGFRGVLDWARDFELCPARVGRRELERLFASVHPGPESPCRRFESKITYPEFLALLTLCCDTGEPMDRSRLDGSCARADETRLDRARRLATYLALPSVKKVRLALHDAYRDVHFWKLSDGADFEKEARAAEMRSRPQWRVEEIAPERMLDPTRDAATIKFMQRFTWLPEETWEEFEGPFIDMGTSFLGGEPRHFRLLITNRQLALGRVGLAIASCGPLRLPWRDTVLGPGQSTEVFLECVPAECGEWCGMLVASASWVIRGVVQTEEVDIPTYMRVLQPKTAGAEVGKRLPSHAPRPFRPGSARRISLDPADSTSRQLRPPTPERYASRSHSRPSSANMRPGSACSGNTTRPPPLPLSSRPGGGLPQAGHSGRDGRTHTPLSDKASHRPTRPHSAPVEKLENLDAAQQAFKGYTADAVGSGVAAARSMRPHSAGLRGRAAPRSAGGA